MFVDLRPLVLPIIHVLLLPRPPPKNMAASAKMASSNTQENSHFY